MRGNCNAIVKAKNTTTLRERCINHFGVLGIPVPPEALDATLLRAEKEALPHLAFLDALLGEQADHAANGPSPAAFLKRILRNRRFLKHSIGNLINSRLTGSRLSN